METEKLEDAVEKCIERCSQRPQKLERCFLVGENLKKCSYVGEAVKTTVNDKYGQPQIEVYYLCNKK